MLTTRPAGALVLTKLGPVLSVGAVPNAKRTEFSGWHGGRLRIHIAAAPTDGQANKALLHWLAGQLKLPMSRLSVLRGGSGRQKQVLIEADLGMVELWLATLQAEA